MEHRRHRSDDIVQGMLWLLACTPTVELDLWEGPNHLLPLYVAVEPGRVWSYSRMLGTVAVIEEGVWIRNFRLEDSPPAPARITATSEGLWVLWSDHAQLLSPTGELLRELDQPVLDVFEESLATPEGVLTQGVLRPTSSPPLRLFDDGVVLLDTGELVDGQDGLICQVPFASRLADWDGLRLAVTKGAEVATCSAGTDPARVTLNEPKQPLWVGGELWVLERISDEDPNASVVRVLDADSLEELRSFPTGKNSGYGGWAGDTLWVNSEGSTEILGLRDEVVTLRVTTGAHVESVMDGVVSGRLSNRLWRGDEELELPWPVAPIRVEGTLFVVLQESLTLVEVDPRTLELGATHVRSSGPLHNPGLTLSDTAWLDGELYVSSGSEDRVFTLSGASFPLGEPLDQDASGRLELVAGDDAIYAVRARDGRVHRIDEDGAGEAVRVELGERTRMQLAAWDDGVLWVGPHGLHGDTLEPVDEADWDFLVGRYREEPLFWRDGGLWLGEELLLTQEGEQPPEVTLVGRKVFVTDIEEASVSTLEL